MADVNWVVDTYILDNNPLYRKIPKTIVELGYGLYESKYVPFSDEQDYGPYTDQDCVILYGTIGFVDKCKIPFVPGAYGVSFTRNKFSNYTQHIPLGYLLNDDYIMTTWGDLNRNPLKYKDIFSSNSLFVRPDSGNKTFAGFVADLNDMEYLRGQQQTSSVMDETLIVLAKPKEIMGEFRFVVCNNEVVSGSEYRWDNILDVRSDYDQDCFKLAKVISELDYQMDTVYTCDVALTKDGPKVVELNAFSCAGLYACDYNKVISVVSEFAKTEMQDR